MRKAAQEQAHKRFIGLSLPPEALREASGPWLLAWGLWRDTDIPWHWICSSPWAGPLSKPSLLPRAPAPWAQDPEMLRWLPLLSPPQDGINKEKGAQNITPGAYGSSPRAALLLAGRCALLRNNHIMCSDKHHVLDQYLFCSSIWYCQGFIYLKPQSFQLKSGLLSLHYAAR